MIRIITILFLFVFFISCSEERVMTPKPKMYPRVIYPEKAYEVLNMVDCQFSFMKPIYAEVKTGGNFFDQEASNSCWFDLEIVSLNSSIHFSYNKIDNENTLDKLVSDAFKLAAKHNSMAEYREEVLVQNANGVNGLLFKIEGPVASPINFYMTDSTQHFVRAALYYNDVVNPDSIAPVIAFINEDIEEILKTFKWSVE